VQNKLCAVFSIHPIFAILIPTYTCGVMKTMKEQTVFISTATTTEAVYMGIVSAVLTNSVFSFPIFC